MAAMAVAAAVAEASSSIGSISSSGGSSIHSGSGRLQQQGQRRRQQWRQQQWKLRWHHLRQEWRQRRQLPNGRALPGQGRRCAWDLPSQLGLCRGLVFASLPIVTMWGGGNSGGRVGAKSTIIKGEVIQQLNGHVGQWQRKTNYAKQKWVWLFVKADNFGGWRRNCNDQRVMEIKKIGMNAIDFFVFLSK
jgi:hypothetical protein